MSILTMEREELAKKVLEYEIFLNDTLKEDLKKILEHRDKVYSELAEYLQLKTVIQNIQENDLGKEGLKTKVDLGCNFYVQANIPDASKIFIAIGFGFFLEMSLPEAITFIDKKTARLNEVADNLTKDAAKVKAHIKLVLEGLREIQGIDEMPPAAPQRDIFS